ncbi:diguanylate cyclase [Caldicellulosiruptor acetigenus I77R1B]|uniref:Diguanylate cyclase n=1 Tax=Caldicellulosiruptor acetigenus (strain ATCC 700853 / DSM 12137 / I77R1B) TaxID=632335 RepID=E4S9N0_CALA7|nr:GGDEF domain-containing protein [Caldicellulosiruptor acetigenus]ADQ40084.1 diguanylate cyclase [Caldicellulosiruptor acetigenus I77R1B]
MSTQLEFCLYKLFEIVGVVAVSGIFIVSAFLGKEIKNTLIYSFGKIFLSLVVFKFLYILNMEKEIVNTLEGIQALVFLNIFSKLLIIYALVFSVLCKEKLKDFLSKTSLWINAALIFIVLLIFEKIKGQKIPVFLHSQTSASSLYIFSEVLIAVGILVLIYMSFTNFYFKQTKSFKVFVLAFAVGEIVLALFKRKGVLFSEAIQNGAMLYLFVAIFLAIAMQRVRFLHSLAKFSTEVLKERLDIQKSFELLVEFIYEAYSKTFPRICFYYQEEDGDYKLIVSRDESTQDDFEDIDIEIKIDQKVTQITQISVFTINEFESMLECRALKNKISQVYQSVVYVPVHRYNRLVGFLICYTKIKDFKMTDELKDGLTIFMNFSQALLSQIERIEKIRNLSTEGELTGLYNRRYFIKELILESIAADRYKNKFCVAFFDMDNLKLLNDFYGHSVGDKAIRMIGRIIRDNIRKTDIPARLGGDEFAVIFKNCSKDAIEDRIKNIKELIEKESELQLPKKIRVSCGVAVYPDDTTSLDELLKIADMRMYDEKLKSKGGDFDAERQ